MGGKTRKTGIDILGDVSWGTHFCQFYQTKEDLVDILEPYFKAGLENNEFCMWITSEPLSEKEAKEAKREALPDFDRYLKREQIEIVPHEEWYLKEGAFNTQRVLNAWIDKHNQALAQGYDGLRLTGNTFWLEKKDWRNFTGYEKKVNNVIWKYKMLAVCSYSLDKCGASEIIDVVSNHQFALIRRKGKWELIESSERKQIEEELGQSRNYFEKLTNSMWDAVFSVKMPERVIEWANDSFRLIGYDPEEYIGKTTEFLYPDESEFEKFGNKLKNAIAAGKDILHAEQLLKRKTGEVFPAEVTTTVFREKGKVSRVTSIVRDITERKLAEDTIKESEKRYRQLFEGISDAIMVYGSQGRFLDCNEVAFKRMGYSREELLSLTASDIVHPDFHKLMKDNQKKIRAGKTTIVESAHRCKDGRIIPVEVNARKIEYKGEPAILAVVRDITERKQAEQALRASEENYRQLTESISDIFFEMDKDLICTYWNRASEKLTGISAKDAIGKSLSELFPDTLNTKKTERVYLDVLRTQQPQTFINEYIFGGKDFFFDISTYPSKRGLSVFAKDITERMQTEEELREKEEFNFALFQHNPIQIIVVDRGGRVLKVNMAKRKSGDRLPNIGDVMYTDYAAKHEIDMHAELMECIRSNKAKRFSELKHGDKFLDITIASFPGGAIITSQDITERKKAEEALRESEGKYRSLFDNMLEGFAYCKIIVDKNNKPVDFEYIEVNDAFEALTGLKKEHITGKKATEAIPGIKKAHPELFKIYGKVALTGKPANFDIYFEPLKIWLSISVYSPKRGYFVAIFDNITERKKGDEALRVLEERYRAIFDQAADSIVLVDRETGDLVEFNEKMYENLGYTREEFKKLKICDFEAIESAEKVAKHIKKIIRDGSDVFETKHRTKGDEIRDILVSSRSISIEGRDFIQSIWSDITDLKKAEEEIKSSQSQLRNLTAHLQSVREEERTLIAREMHDELGQALTALKMDLSWLDNRLPKDQKSLLEKTKSMSKLVDATLQTVKRISTELRPGLLDDLGLPAAIEWQAEEFQTRTGIKCEITVDPEDIILDKDRSTAIFRIFQETLTNVTRHAKATKVKVSLKEKAGKIELKVRDNGKGITEEQVSNPKSFGLIGIKERAYYLGGKVVIKSLQDKGTTLTIRIPLPKKGKTK